MAWVLGRVREVALSSSTGLRQVRFRGATRLDDGRALRRDERSGNGHGRWISSAGVTFTVTGALSITAISPSAGSVGSSVTISGAGFGSSQSDSVVTFDGVAATVSSWSDTQIVAYRPGWSGNRSRNG